MRRAGSEDYAECIVNESFFDSANKKRKDLKNIFKSLRPVLLQRVNFGSGQMIGVYLLPPPNLKERPRFR